MSLTQQELDHLKKLARIQFDDSEKEKQFLWSMQNIVAMLEQLQSLDIQSDVSPSPFMDKLMHIHPNQQDFADSDSLLANIQHPLINNSVVVKSVLD
jgi:aspartyl/glutamyl-tRNA(Asn/Gln) amidotransferase C subunit